MSVAALLSLALLSGDASAFKLAQAEAPVSTGQSAEAEIRAAAAAAGDPFPAGAPVDDYGFVGWCYGALMEHMTLKPRVWSEVQRIEAQFPDPNTPLDASLAAYDAQAKEGEVQLALFQEALAAKRGDRAAAIAKGQAIWSGSQASDDRKLAQFWMSWSLPARCDTTAKRMLGR